MEFFLITVSKITSVQILTAHNVENYFVNYTLKCLNAEGDPGTKSH